MDNRWDSRGFTFLDLLLVLSVIAVLVGIAVPGVQDSVQNYQLGAAADELAANFNRTRMLAVSQGAVYQVQFDTQGSSYRIVNISDSQHTTPVVKFLGNSLQFKSVPRSPITFSSRGVARGGQVVLATPADQTVVVAVGASGKTVIQHYEEGTDPPDGGDDPPIIITPK